MIYIKILLVILWLASGAASFVYWITKKHNIDLYGLFVMTCMSIFGPFMFFIGWYSYGESIFKDKVIFKKRNK